MIYSEGFQELHDQNLNRETENN